MVEEIGLPSEVDGLAQPGDAAGLDQFNGIEDLEQVPEVQIQEKENLEQQ